MEDGHGSDPDPPAEAGAGPCTCCSPPSAVVRWRRSVKRKLDGEKEEGDDWAVGLARVDAGEETAALWEALAAAQDEAAALRVEVDEERLAAASAASEAMAMMLRLQREKAEVQMELRQFRRFADEKMALDAAEIDHLRALLAGRPRDLARIRSRLREYRHTCLSLGIPLPDGEEGEEQDQEGDAFTEGEDGDYYPELRCHDGQYYYEDGREESEEDATTMDLEHRISLLEHGQEGLVLGPSLVEEEEEEEEEEEGGHLYTDEVLPVLPWQDTTGLCADEALPEETEQNRSHLCDDDDGDDDDELPESLAAECDVEEDEGGSYGGGDDDGNGSDRVYTIDKVHQGVVAPVARVLDKYEDEAVEPDIKKLYMRLEALEADRESMRQALLAMRSEKAQLTLLREIAQHLTKDANSAATGVGVVPITHRSPGQKAGDVMDRRVREDKKRTLARTFSKVALFKCIITLFCSQKKPSQSRYTFGVSSNNVGLLVLLDKGPRIQKHFMKTL